MIVVFRQLLASVLSCVLAVPAFCDSCDMIANRVSKTAAGVTTTYLVDTLNPTGYPQVVNESFSGGTAGNREQNHAYVYGLELISQVRSYQASFNNLTQRIYYVYDAVCASRMNLRDGHGSVRALTDPTGAVTDTYDYDAFGNLIHSSTTLSTPTLNNYLFAGEQFDSDIGLYYNRARYLNVSTGRFWTMDAFEGDPQSPSALHKYAYTWNDPINHLDRSGHGIEDVTLAAYVYVTTQLGAVLNVATIVAQTTALVLVAADAAGYLTSDRSLVSTYIATGGNPAAEIGTIYGEIRTLRTALALSRVESVFAQASATFSEGETAIINEARQILGSSELAQIKEAFHAGREIQVVINGRIVGYQPGLPFSGMTWFEQRGFIFGDQAFSSDAELEKTVFHELYRLSPLAPSTSSGVGGDLAEQATLQAYLFAQRASGQK